MPVLIASGGFVCSIGMSQRWWGHLVLGVNPFRRRGSKLLALKGSGAWLERSRPLQCFGKPFPVSGFGEQVCTSANEVS